MKKQRKGTKHKHRGTKTKQKYFGTAEDFSARNTSEISGRKLRVKLHEMGINNDNTCNQDILLVMGWSCEVDIKNDKK